MFSNGAALSSLNAALFQPPPNCSAIAAERLTNSVFRQSIVAIQSLQFSTRYLQPIVVFITSCDPMRSQCATDGCFPATEVIRKLLNREAIFDIQLLQ